MRTIGFFSVVLAGLILAWHPATAAAQKGGLASLPEDASEDYIIWQITVVRESLEVANELRPFYMIQYVDTLLERFPETSFRDEALILKLTSLSALARRNPENLQQLLALTEKISQENPKGKLASENDFYAIQAFVLGARLEDMPEQRRLAGTRERYEAFLEDHPDSNRAPTITASLVRNLLAMNQVDQAEKWANKLREKYPDHRATRRAEGELFRAKALGKPFKFEHTMSDGKTLRTTDYLGKVVVLHFWRTRTDEAMQALPELVKLHDEFKDKGLKLIGVNVDRDRSFAFKAIEAYKVTWDQFYDLKGFRSEALIKNGVVRIPSYFVIDRAGVLRSTDPGDKLRELVKQLLPPTPETASPEGTGADTPKKEEATNKTAP